MNSSHDAIREALSDYAQDALSDQEQAVVSAHLAACPACCAELAEIRRVMTEVGGSTEPDPSAALRSQVLARAVHGAAPRPPPTEAATDRTPPGARPGTPRWLLLAASIALAVAAGTYALSLRSQVASLRQMAADASASAAALRHELARARRDAAALTRAVDVLRAPDLLRVDLKGQGTASRATGRVFWSRTTGLTFSASGLPALEGGRVYQLWTITGTTATSAGVMTVDASGAITHTAAPGADPPDAFGVTIEPAGGSAAPTLPIVMIGTTR